MTVCRAFATTPDVASRLLSPAWRPVTRACLEYSRAERVVGEWRSLGAATEEQKAAVMGRWRETGDGDFFKELLRASGREQPGIGEL